MKYMKNSVEKWITGTICLAMVSVLGAAPAWAQSEKRTVYTEHDFRWQGHLKAGQTLEVINQNGQIEATSATGDEARTEGMWRGDAERDLFIEVVEYSDGVTICAVHAKDKAPGRCHRGGVSSESWPWGWRGNQAKINFDVQVPRGVNFHALTTNGSVVGRNLASVVEAATTNGNVEVSTSEWASATTTNGGIRVYMGGAKWTGELKVRTTNGSVEVTMPASAEFRVDAATTNGGIQTDFPVTVQGSFSSKELSGTVGGGGRELKVATTNGTIRLMKS
jgi:Putative adhesin